MRREYYDPTEWLKKHADVAEKHRMAYHGRGIPLPEATVNWVDLAKPRVASDGGKCEYFNLSLSWALDTIPLDDEGYPLMVEESPFWPIYQDYLLAREAVFGSKYPPLFNRLAWCRHNIDRNMKGYIYAESSPHLKDSIGLRNIDTYIPIPPAGKENSPIFMVRKGLKLTVTESDIWPGCSILVYGQGGISSHVDAKTKAKTQRPKVYLSSGQLSKQGPRIFGRSATLEEVAAGFVPIDLGDGEPEVASGMGLLG